MTSYVNNKTDKPSETKPEEPKEPEKVSRFKASPQIWNEAMVLADMLGHCRPHLSRTESRFINKYIRPAGVGFDKKGNIIKKVGDAPVLWSCHTDTVHSAKGIQGIEYWIGNKTGDTYFGVKSGEKSSCLGADDTAGVWLMLEMIRNNIPGLYVFHRGEECGGLGSKWIAANNKDLVKDIKFAIAFDRRDVGSIITYQRGSRCCSDEFANSLAEQIGMGHKCDTTGSFTDTASYVDLIGECTNVSVGYYDAHCKTEHQNVDYLFRLRDAICKMDISKLTEKRKPGEVEKRTWSYSGGTDFWGGSYYDEAERPAGGFRGWELRDKWGNLDYMDYYLYDNATGFWKPMEGVTIPEPATVKPKKDLGVTKGWVNRQREMYARINIANPTHADVIKMIKENPVVIADLLELQGYGPKEILDAVIQGGGTINGVYYYKH